jgi:hypothetical protein
MGGRVLVPCGQGTLGDSGGSTLGAPQNGAGKHDGTVGEAQSDGSPCPDFPGPGVGSGKPQYSCGGCDGCTEGVPQHGGAGIGASVGWAPHGAGGGGATATSCGGRGWTDEG